MQSSQVKSSGRRIWGSTTVAAAAAAHLLPLEARSVLDRELVGGDADVESVELGPACPELLALLGIAVVRQHLCVVEVGEFCFVRATAGGHVDRKTAAAASSSRNVMEINTPLPGKRERMSCFRHPIPSLCRRHHRPLGGDEMIGGGGGIFHLFSLCSTATHPLHKIPLFVRTTHARTRKSHNTT